MPANSVAQPKVARPWLWPTAIIAILSAHAIAMGAVVFVATRDPSFAVEPNAYKKALAWDNAQARRRASEELGWTARVQTGVNLDVQGKRRVAIRLTDKAGVPVMAASVQLEVFSHSRATERTQLNLMGEEGGVYAADVPMRRAGTWEFRIAARRGDSSFSTVVTQPVENSP